MIEAGIIDPVKVIRTALQDAARYISKKTAPRFFRTRRSKLVYESVMLLGSVSLLMATTEAAVSELPATKSRIASRMPQMSGMDF